MYLDDDAAIVGGRELWGFPKKLAKPEITHEGEVIVGTLHYGKVLCATATIGYKHRPAHHASVLATMQQPNFLLKAIPHADGSPRICAIVRYHLEEIQIQKAWHTPAELQLLRPLAAAVAPFPGL